MVNKERTFDDFLIESWKKDPELAIEFLNVALQEYFENENDLEFLHALKTYIEVQGNISDFARKANIEYSHLYKILNRKVTPKFNTISKIISTAGLMLKVEKKEESEAV